MTHESAGQTLQPTALVHEAYLRLVEGAPATQHWHNRGHFFAAAAEAMRRILIDRARRRLSLKGGGGQRPLDLAHLENVPADDDGRSDDELLALNEALDELEKHDQQAARLVNLRYFAGLTHQDAADAMGVTRRAADRLWALARAWLYRRISRP